MVGLSSPLSLLTALALSGSALAQLGDTGLEGKNTTFPGAGVATRFVVEFSEEGSSKFRKRDGSLDTQDFYEKIKDTNVTAVPALNFTSELFHGASFEITNGESVGEIEALPEVKKIWPVSVVYAPKPDTVQRADGPEISKWDPHVLTRVNDVHGLGYDGSGVIVAVVDSGIDYTHPALGGGFGPGFKVESGWDFVGDKYDVENPSVIYPDRDPKDCLGHGTHVAGIIASSNKALPGVAPKARLRAYKVFGCSDGVTEDIIGQAIIKAFEDGADIITASLGSDSGFTDNLVAVLISKITAQGTFVSAAAGNSGSRGPFLSSNLGNAYGSLTVGSVGHTQNVVYKVVAKSSSGQSRTIYYVPDNGLQWNRKGSYNAYLPPVSRDYDICSEWGIPMPSGGLRANDILVAARGYGGVCQGTWQSMDSILLQDQVKWVFFYNYPNKTYETPDRTRYREDQPIGFASINYDDGIWLEEQDEAGHKIQFVFENPAETLGVKDSSVKMDEFSSWGSTLNGRMKPEISAPGGRILSTYLTNSGSWAVFSGTSMATPYIAGVAALFFQSAGGRKSLGSNPADAAVRRIMASGRSVGHWDGQNVAAGVAHQGAGLVDAFKVVAFDTSISPANIQLNDTMFFKAKHTITITNKGKKTVKYTIGHENGSTVRSRGEADAWISYEPEIRTDQGLARVKFSAREVRVPAGGSASFNVEFTEPTDVDPAVLAMYGGAIHVVGDNGEAVKATYMGIHGSLYDADIWETHRGVPLFFGQDQYGDAFENGRVFQLPDLPTLYFNSLWSTREESFDLVAPDWQPSDWVYPPVPGKNKFIGHLVYFQPLVGEYFPFPIKDLVRATGVFWLSLKDELAHGKKIGPGEYRILSRALRTYGDYNKAKDWQFRLSNTFKTAAA